jgi:ATP-utilizing enzymes of the PP-loop superfamily
VRTASLCGQAGVRSLSSRFPTGTRITRDLLDQVERSEDVLWDLGFRQFRVRHHGDLARIEVPREDLPRLLDTSEPIVGALKQFGYRFVTMDLAGFRSGGTVLLGDYVAVSS